MSNFTYDVDVSAGAERGNSDGGRGKPNLSNPINSLSLIHFCLVAGYVRLYWSPTSEWHRGGDNFHYSVTWYVESDSGPPRLAASPDWERVSGNRAFVDVEAEPGVCSCVNAYHETYANQVCYVLGPSTALQSAEPLLCHNSRALQTLRR